MCLDIVGAKFIREVENGEIVVIENQSLKSIKPFPLQKPDLCIFEYIYFARPDSIIDENVPMNLEKISEKELAAETDYIDADIVVLVLDSGVPAAIGYAEQSKKKFELGLIRNHYVGRTLLNLLKTLGV